MHRMMHNAVNALIFDVRLCFQLNLFIKVLQR